MARGKLTQEQRAELHVILDWIRSPSTKPIESLAKLAVRCFLNGEDAHAFLMTKGVEEFIVRRAVDKARVFIGNERGKRRRFADDIRKARTRKLPTFTHENFRVTMDHTQDRNYGMANVSIYCVVEVWQKEEELEPEKTHLVNFSDYHSKEWLIRMMVWALTNEREILVRPAGDVEMSSMRMFVPRDKAAVA